MGFVIDVIAVINDEGEIINSSGKAIEGNGIIVNGKYYYPAGIDKDLKVIADMADEENRPLTIKGSSILNYTIGEQLYLFAYLEYKEELGEETKKQLIGVFTDYNKFKLLTNCYQHSVSYKIQKINQIIEY